MDPVEDYRSYWKDQCRVSGGSIKETDQCRVRGPRGAWPMHGVLVFSGKPLEAKAEAQAWIAEGAPFSITTQSRPVGQALTAAGMFLHVDFCLLRAPVADLGEPAHEVRWNEDPDAFVDVQMDAHDIPDEARTALAYQWQVAADEGLCHLGVVYDGDKPVGCGAIYTGAGNAGLYAFGVAASHRRHGVGRSILQAAMRKAEALGLQHAVAAATQDGQTFGAAHGFQEVGRLAQYVWFPR